MVVPSTLFEELGFNYIGPVDGHDVHTLTQTLKNMRDLKSPQLLHIMTKRAKAMLRQKRIQSVGMPYLSLIPPPAPCLKARAASPLTPKYLANGYAKPQPKIAN